MLKRSIIAVGLVAGIVFSAGSAAATCVPGRIGVDPRTGEITIELPRCEPPPTA
jgi:hypothetical protein